MPPPTTVQKISRAGHAFAGKYLVFWMGSEHYGIEILRVREIIGMLSITAVPRMPAHVKGVVNLRGKIVPVIDLRRKFDMPAAAVTDQTCIIVVCIGEVEMGVIVDGVSDVLDIHAEDIDDTPSFGEGLETGFILGIGKVGTKVNILLDIAQVLSRADVHALKHVADAVRETV